MLNNKGHVLAFNDSPLVENSPLDSISYNKIIDSLKTSTLRSINRTRDLAANMVKLNKALAAENRYLTGKVNQLSVPYNNETNTELITGYDSYIDSNQIEKDNLTGQIIIKPSHKWSKVIRYLDRNGRNRASKDISISLNGYAQPIDSDIYSILDGYNDSYWLYDTTPDSVYTISINFPTSIKPYINYLRLTPFPAFGYTIQNISVLKADGNLFSIYDGTSANLGIIDMHFKTISWGGQINITLKASDNVIGIADLDIGLEDYYETTDATNTSSFSSVTYALPNLTNIKLAGILYMNMDLFNLFGDGIDSTFNINNIVQAYLYKNDTTGNGTQLLADTMVDIGTGTGKASTPFTKNVGEPLYIKFVMQKYMAQTPILKAVKIKYQPGA